MFVNVCVLVFVCLQVCVSPQAQLSFSVHSRLDSPGWGWLRNTPGTLDSFCCPRSLNTLHRWPAEGQREKGRRCWEAAKLLTVNCLKEIFHLFPDFSLSLHPFISTSYQTVPKFLLSHLCLTAPQDLQWCLRFVKLKLSLQPLHVCFSFSFFLELFWKTWRKTKHRSHVSRSSVYWVSAQPN